MLRNHTLFSALAGLGLWLASAPASAVPLFSDNFDADTAGLNAPGGLINWTIDNGTVDVIQSGGFGISCVGGTGRCLDMDGSTGNGGRIVSKDIFELVPGAFYELTAMISGNQRNSAIDTFSMGVLDATTLNPFGSGSGPVAGADPFSLQTFGISLGAGGNVRLFFEDPGADNIGYILDDVAFECIRGCDVAGVPEPGILALLGIGLAGAGYASRRRRT